jgi:hypothetical protein
MNRTGPNSTELGRIKPDWTGPSGMSDVRWSGGLIAIIVAEP